MKLTAELKDQIKAIAEEYSWDYAVIAIRVQEVPFALGQIDHHSKVWVDGDETDEELNGICGTKVECLDYISGFYGGDHLAVIGGHTFEYGEDAGEVIIADAEVIEIIA